MVAGPTHVTEAEAFILSALDRMGEHPLRTTTMLVHAMLMAMAGRSAEARRLRERAWEEDAGYVVERGHQHYQVGGHVELIRGDGPYNPPR